MTVIANMRRGDLHPALRLRLDSSGEPVTNLAEANLVQVWMQQPDESVTSREADLGDQDAEPGWVTMQWQPGDTDQVGDIGIEVEVIWPGDRPQTWPAKGVIAVRIHEDLSLTGD